MRTAIVQRRREGIDAQTKAGRYNPATIITFKEREYLSQAGNSDDAYYYYEHPFLYELVINHRLGYCGISKYDATGDDPGLINYDFFQNLDDLDALLDKKDAINAFSPLWLAKYLAINLE